MDINKLANQIHQSNIDKGFYENEKNIGEMLCLIHSEVSEALEADRKDKYCRYSAELLLTATDDEDFKKNYQTYIKGKFEEEMADIFIRVLDMCAYLNIDLENQVKCKMRYNALRE